MCMFCILLLQIASMITIAPVKKVGEAKIVLSNWLVVKKWHAWIMELVPLGWWEKLITGLIVPANLDILDPGVKVRLPSLWRVIPTLKCLPMEVTVVKDMNSPWDLGKESFLRNTTSSLWKLLILMKLECKNSHLSTTESSISLIKYVSFPL